MNDTTEIVKTIAKIEGSSLGWEDHGIFTVSLTMNYGGSGQGVGGYALDEPFKIDGKHAGRRGTAYGMEFVCRTLKACGVNSWEKLQGRTVYVLHDGEPRWGSHDNVLGIENLPTEPGNRFLFRDLLDEFAESEPA